MVMHTAAAIALLADPKKARHSPATILEALARIDPVNAVSLTRPIAWHSWFARGQMDGMGESKRHRYGPCRWCLSQQLAILHAASGGFVGFIETKHGCAAEFGALVGIVRTMQARGVRIVGERAAHRAGKRLLVFVARKAGASTVTLARSVGALARTTATTSTLVDSTICATLTAGGGNPMIEPLVVYGRHSGLRVFFFCSEWHPRLFASNDGRQVICRNWAGADRGRSAATVAFMLGIRPQIRDLGYSLASTCLQPCCWH